MNISRIRHDGPTSLPVTLAEYIGERHRKTGTVETQTLSLRDGGASETRRTIGPLLPVAVPAWLVAGINIRCRSTVLVEEVSPLMCLVKGDEWTWAIETSIIVEAWEVAT